MIRNVEEDDHYYGANSAYYWEEEMWVDCGGGDPTPCLCLSLDTSPFLSATLRSATADLNPLGDVVELLDVKLRIRRARYGGLSQGRSYGGATGAAVPGSRVQGTAELIL
jgi:hypothetical protein